ncbi:PASTA domain-containing protein [Paenibacillus piri]|uniref:PASTA domain-containing protein n=1 Tax=Paenibacillus piri TaxID=2547395 RepID=A0A4R5KYS9_9BACL|nr:PASTA domain-containing protein [Paenibacillus piri]TDG00231.1 PASTA domain-containing protein [Paenibacillus piri]
MKPVSNRYTREEFIIPLDQGQLYKGKDLSLNRIVFIYAVPYQSQSLAEAYLQAIGGSAQVTNNPQYMHVFDVEMDHDYIYVIMKYIEGQSLQQLIRTHTFTFREAAAFVAGIGHTLAEIAVERPLNFSIQPSNLWMTDQGQLTIVNTWDTHSGNRRLVQELSGLFFRLLTRREQVPSDIESLRHGLQSSPILNELLEPQRRAAVETILHAHDERMSALAFIQSIKELPEAVPTDDHVNGHDHVSAPDENAQSANSMTRPEEKYVFELEAELRYRSRNATPGEEEADRTRAMPSLLSRTLFGATMWKRLSIGLSLALLGGAVFVGVFAFLIDNTGRKETAYMPGGAASGRQQPSETEQQPKPEDNQPAKETEATNNGGDSSVIIPVPALTGLTKEAAEKQALASGLRYTYYLETNQLAAGTVFKQEPMPNEQAAKGSRVTFWISKGNPAP